MPVLPGKATQPVRAPGRPSSGLVTTGDDGPMVEVSTVRRAGLRRWLARDTRRSPIAVLPMFVACCLDPALCLEPDLTTMAGVLRLWFALMLLVAVLCVVTTFYAFGRESGEGLVGLLRMSGPDGDPLLPVLARSPQDEGASSALRPG